MAYRSAKHETTGATPAELCFARNLRLPLDLLRGSPPNDGAKKTITNYVYKLREKLEILHQNVRQHLEIKSEGIL